MNAPPLHLHAAAQPRLRYTTVALDAADATDTRALFAQVFGQPMSPELWHWKYADGRGMALGVRDTQSPQADLVAHYGGTLRVLHTPQAEHTVAHLGDVMVAPRARAVFSRRGPFGDMTAQFIQRFLSGPQRRADAGFGFPNGRHMRLGQHLGLYAPVDEMCQVTLDASAAADLDLEPFADWTAFSAATVQQLDLLWQRQASALRAQGMSVAGRGADWWRHRFAHHPHHSHLPLWWLGAGGEVQAALVLRLVDAQHIELLDWLAPPELGLGVLQAAAQAAHGAKRAQVSAWISRSALQAMGWDDSHLPSGMQVQTACPIGLTLAPAGSASHLPPASLGRGLWATGGDTDFR